MAHLPEEVKEIIFLYHNICNFRYKSIEYFEAYKKYADKLKDLTPEHKNLFIDCRRLEILKELREAPSLKSEQLILSDEDIKNYY